MERLTWAALAVVVGAQLVLSACNSKKTPEMNKEVHHEAASFKQVEPSADTDQPNSTDHIVVPLLAPESYFGELDLARISKPLKLEPKKNSSVILVVIDAFNPKHMGIYGYQRSTTPNLDKLAHRGLLLSNYVSNSSWTRPSYTTIITGLPKSVHGVELGGRHLEKEITTLAERFRKAGYRTAGFVGNPLVREIWGYGQGFQVYVDTKALDKAFPPDATLMDRALSWLKKGEDKPSFLVLFLTAPHVPYRPPTRHRRFLKELPKGDVIQYPFKEYLKPLSKMDQARMVAAYDGDVMYADEQVGRLFDYLESAGRIENTSLLITADHGEVFGHHNCYVHAYHMWDPALRVPFILVSNALTRNGVYDDRPFTHVDIAPTLLELAGLPAPADLPGTSLVKALVDPATGRDRVLFSQYNAHGIRRQAIRKGGLKLVHHHKVNLRDLKDLDKLHTKIPQPDPKDLPSLAVDGERYELYDLVDDPKEKKDLFKSRRDEIMTKELLDALGPHVDGHTIAPALSEETLKALKAAGYIERNK